MAKNNKVKKGKKKDYRTLIIAIAIIIILVIGFAVYTTINSEKQPTSSSSDGDYVNLQTADDDFAALEESLNSLNAANP